MKSSPTGEQNMESNVLLTVSLNYVINFRVPGEQARDQIILHKYCVSQQFLGKELK